MSKRWINLRVGSKFAARMAIAARTVKKDRSVWVCDAVNDMIESGFPEVLPSKLVVEALRKDGRMVVLMEEKQFQDFDIFAELHRLTKTDTVIFASIGALVKDRGLLF